MHILSHSVTDVGAKRHHNEDFLLLDPKLNLYVIADGMGGEQHGERAAQLAVETVVRYIRENHTIIEAYKATGSNFNKDKVVNMLKAAVQYANTVVYKEAEKLGVAGNMGTTLSLILFVNNVAFAVHVGDTRIYLYRNKELTQLTHDHTIMGEYLLTYGKVPEHISPELSHSLTRAVGLTKFVQVDHLIFNIFAGDKLLLSTDGLHQYFKEENEYFLSLSFDKLSSEITEEELKEFGRQLLNFAYHYGADDNISFITILIQGDTEETTTSRELVYKLDIIRNSVLFKTLTYAELLKILEIAEIRSYNKYEVLMKENETQDSDKSLYLLLEGEASVLKHAKVVYRVLPGDHIGELSLIDNKPRSATIFVEKPSTFLIIKRKDFVKLINENPEIGVKILWEIAHTIASRLRTTTEIAFSDDKK